MRAPAQGFYGGAAWCLLNAGRAAPQPRLLPPVPVTCVAWHLQLRHRRPTRKRPTRTRAPSSEFAMAACLSRLLAACSNEEMDKRLGKAASTGGGKRRGHSPLFLLRMKVSAKSIRRQSTA